MYLIKNNDIIFDRLDILNNDKRLHENSYDANYEKYLKIKPSLK